MIGELQETHPDEMDKYCTEYRHNDTAPRPFGSDDDTFIFQHERALRYINVAFVKAYHPTARDNKVWLLDIVINAPRSSLDSIYVKAHGRMHRYM